MKSSFDNFHEFKKFIEQRIPIGIGSVGFIVSYPDKLNWDFAVERQTQMTWAQLTRMQIEKIGERKVTSKGEVKLCLQSEVMEVIKELKNRKIRPCTHVMICQAGMVFHTGAKVEGIECHSVMDFYSFIKSNEYMKGHIIAHPNKAAFIHPEHILLNLNKWQELKCPDIFKDFKEYERAEDNFHDDYTPSWIIPKGLPKIYNFTEIERGKKGYSYHNKEYQDMLWDNIVNNKKWWEAIPNDQPGSYYSNPLKRNCNFKETRYYYQNNEDFYFEKIPRLWTPHIIFTPCSGYIGEKIACSLKTSLTGSYPEKIIFYDFNDKIVNVKKQIIELNPTYDELKILIKENEKENIDPCISYEDYMKESHETCRKYVENVKQYCDIEFWTMDLLNANYDKIITEVTEKNVFFNASNIYVYNYTLLYYTVKEIIDAKDKLEESLKHSNNYYLRADTPFENIRKFHENILR